MHVRIESVEPDETGRLYRWLRSDRTLATAAAKIEVSAGLETLNAIEVIDVVLGHTTDISSLVLAFVAWRQSRPQRPQVTFTRPDGRTMTVEGPVDQAQAEAITQFLTGTDEASDGPR